MLDWTSRGRALLEQVSLDAEAPGTILDAMPLEDLKRMLTASRVMSSVVYDRIQKLEAQAPQARSAIHPEPPAIRVVQDTKQARRTSSTGTGNNKKGPQ